MRGSAYTRDHLLAALEWIERHHARGIELVARALANTGDIPDMPRALRVDAICRCGHVNDVHGDDGDCNFPGCSCGLFVLPLGGRVT